jgi:hypothetical protein
MLTRAHSAAMAAATRALRSRARVNNLDSTNPMANP